MKHTILVTAEDISQGQHGECMNCPIALAMNRSELQDVSFYGEETTDKWTLENLQIQFVKDQMEFYESDNLDHQVEETWEKINANDN